MNELESNKNEGIDTRSFRYDDGDTDIVYED